MWAIIWVEFLHFCLICQYNAYTFTLWMNELFKGSFIPTFHSNVLLSVRLSYSWLLFIPPSVFCIGACSNAILPPLLAMVLLHVIRNCMLTHFVQKYWWNDRIGRAKHSTGLRYPFLCRALLRRYVHVSVKLAVGLVFADIVCYSYLRKHPMD